MERFSRLGIELKEGKNQQRVKCPSCLGKRSLSVNIGLKLYNCFSCSFKGKISKYEL